MSGDNINFSRPAGEIFSNIQDEEMALLVAVARNAYVRHVSRMLLEPERIGHDDDIDWWEERRQHIQEQFPLPRELTELAIHLSEAMVNED